MDAALFAGLPPTSHSAAAAVTAVLDSLSIAP
jgi:hypothetical protein